MSHFVVMVELPAGTVISNRYPNGVDRELTRIMAPFSEELVDPYEEPISDEELSRVIEYYGKERRSQTTSFSGSQTETKELVEPAVELDRSNTAQMKQFLHKYFEQEIVERDGQYFRLSTYNPNSKWDWYVVGGRWTGWMRVKRPALAMVGAPGLMTPMPTEPSQADVATKANIDIEAMQEAEYQLGLKAFAKFEVETARFIADHPDWQPSEREEKFGITTVEQAAHEWAYWASGVKFDETPTAELHAQKLRDAALLPQAFVTKNGEWHEMGQMGWFGMSSNDKEDNVWDKEFRTWFDALPDDAVIAVVDCHI